MPVDKRTSDLVELARYVIALAVLLVILSIVGLVIVITLKGGSWGSPAAIGGLIAGIATLIGLLLNVLATGALASGQHRVIVSQDSIEAQLNGHLEAHMGLTDDKIRAAVEDEVNRRLGAQVSAPDAQGGT